MSTSSENLDETPFQTAGPFIHLGCMPNAIKIKKLYQNDLGVIPFNNKNQTTTNNHQIDLTEIEQEDKDIEEKVLEIPAFLRRQAN